MKESTTLDLKVRRVIAASPARLFEAWTTPAQLQRWWGPRDVRCIHAEIDPRVGGRYRIGNELPDGSIVWITGKFMVVDRPERLVYSWNREPGGSTPERVTVRFRPHESGTEVVVVHERVVSARQRDEHERGWDGCLNRLAEFVGGVPAVGMQRRS